MGVRPPSITSWLTGYKVSINRNAVSRVAEGHRGSRYQRTMSYSSVRRKRMLGLFAADTRPDRKGTTSKQLKMCLNAMMKHLEVVLLGNQDL